MLCSHYVKVYNIQQCPQHAYRFLAYHIPYRDSNAVAMSVKHFPIEVYSMPKTALALDPSMWKPDRSMSSCAAGSPAIMAGADG